MLILETNYLQLLNPPYNILIYGGSTFGYKHNEETKKKMRDNYSKERKDKIGSLNKGKKLSEEIREKMRVAAYKRPSMSLSCRLKWGLSNSKSVIAYNLDGTIYKKEESMIKLANFLHIGQKSLRLAIRCGKLIKNKWIIKFDKNLN